MFNPHILALNLTLSQASLNVGGWEGDCPNEKKVAGLIPLAHYMCQST